MLMNEKGESFKIDAANEPNRFHSNSQHLEGRIQGMQ
jgi:hypothetical protein